MRMNTRTRGFSMVELLVVIVIIGMLAALILTAVRGSGDAARTAETQNGLRQIATWMQAWSGDNEDRVLPSQFDFSEEVAGGEQIRVRNDEHLDSLQYRGTWTDILWTDNGMHVTYGLRDREEEDADHLEWETNSPDASIFDEHEDFKHPFRSRLENTRDYLPREQSPDPLPYGTGAHERGLPGYFAANDFFDARSESDLGTGTSTVDRYYTNGMIKAPNRSVYLVDSVAGETIALEEEPWTYDFGQSFVSEDSMGGGDGVEALGQIDYRYGGTDGACFLLLLDGHVEQQAPWSSLGLNDGSEEWPFPGTLQGRGYRVERLHRRN